jgi:(p)ppGpp synthase/HD superfamily hydrolase
MLSQQITPADCFSATTTTTMSPVSQQHTSLHYTISSSTTTAGHEPSSLFYHHPLFSIRNTKASRLPPWLATDRSHLVAIRKETLMQHLQRHEHFSTEETHQLWQVITTAAEGNDNWIAGAAEFCHLISETTELGLHALMAAAIHYCDCVRFRERGTPLTPTTVPSIASTPVPSIVADATRLKDLELTAWEITDTTHNKPSRFDARDAENLRHLILSETKDWRALAIRSAACLFRLRGIDHSQTHRNRQAIRVAREALHMYAPLASRLGMHRLKNELESHAFQILYPRQYITITSMIHSNDTSQSMAQVLDQVRDEMTQLLMHDVEFQNQVQKFQVKARVKEPYSLWKKMLRMRVKNVFQIPDALALRIVLTAKKETETENEQVTRGRDRALCYYAQTLCLQRWKAASADPRFKDYIGKPKTNGYQSLHYTAETTSQGHTWNFEVQVRSHAMHQIAEFGLASHWEYKITQQKPSIVASNHHPQQKVTLEEEMDKSSDAYLRKVQAWKQHGGQLHAAASTSSKTAVSSIPSPLSSSSSSSLESLERADRIRELQPYLDALKSAQSDLERERVFVFLKTTTSQSSSRNDDNDHYYYHEGTVLSLPSGACVLDALRNAEQTLGVRVKRDEVLDLNGHDTSVTRQLHNGDILKIPYVAMVHP